MRQIADHLLMWGPDTEAALRSAAELADLLRPELGLRRRWDVPAADGTGPGDSASRVFAAPLAPSVPQAAAPSPELPPLSVVELEPHGFDVPPRHAPVRAWEQAPVSSRGGSPRSTRHPTATINDAPLGIYTCSPTDDHEWRLLSKGQS